MLLSKSLYYCHDIIVSRRAERPTTRSSVRWTSHVGFRAAQVNRVKRLYAEMY